MEKADYYATLGVDRGVGDAELKKAYRKLAMQYHPDRNPGDAEAEQKFKDVSEAYDVPKDPQKRAAYDQFGHAAFENGMGGGGPGGFGGGGFDFGGSFSDIFEDLFGEGFGGRRARRNGPARGADLRFNYEVTLEQAFTGKSAEISLTTSVACDSCNGSGAAEGSQPQACPTCGGMGKTRTQQGFFTVERACHQCHGAGQIVTDPCTDCSGAGVVEKEKTLSVNIPPGVENGTRIRLAHEGEAGRRGGPPGDLYLFISVKPHPVFDRQGDHILCRVPISMATAALGGDIEVPTIAGKRVRLSIPDGTQSGRQFRLKSKGMPKLQRSGFGDMLVQIDVETPVNLTKKQKDLLRQFDEEGENTNPQSEGFFSRLKELWDDLTD